MSYKNKIYSVITGDIIRSSKLTINKRKAILKKIEHYTFDLPSKNGKKIFEIFRGDSFQGIINKPEESLITALKVILIIKIKNLENYSNVGGLRVGIGIGKVSSKSEKINFSNGEAFLYSGHALDNMKHNERIRIKTPWEECNKEFDIYCLVLDKLINKWSKFQSRSYI